MCDYGDEDALRVDVYVSNHATCNDLQHISSNGSLSTISSRYQMDHCQRSQNDEYKNMLTDMSFFLST